MHEKPLGLETVRSVRQMDERSRAAPRLVASMTWRSFIRWSRNRTCTARRPSCRTPASCCRAFPRMGAWVSYGLGQSDGQPADLRRAAGRARLRPERAGELEQRVFCPPAHQGTMIRVGKPNPIFDLFPPESAQIHHAGERTASAWRCCKHFNQRSRRPREQAIRDSTRGLPPTKWRRSFNSALPRCWISSGEADATTKALRTGREDHSRTSARAA